MARGKKHTAERVVNLLRQIEVSVANGKSTALACREAAITEQTYYRRRKEYGALKVVIGACAEHGISERHACRLVKQPRGTQRYRPTQREDEDALAQAIVALASHMTAMVIAGSQRCSSGPAGT
jgi:hypothetical protein